MYMVYHLRVSLTFPPTSRKTRRVRRNAPLHHDPPPIKSALVGFATHRYVCNGTTDQAVTFNQLFQLSIVAATDGSTGYRLFSSFRLRSIEAWTPTAAALTARPILLISWSDALAADDGMPFIPTSDTSVSSDSVAHLLLRPVPTSKQGQWRNTSVTDTANAFVFTAPEGTVMDISFDYAIVGKNDQVSTGAVVGSFTGATAGQIYRPTFAALVPFKPSSTITVT